MFEQHLNLVRSRCIWNYSIFPQNEAIVGVYKMKSETLEK